MKILVNSCISKMDRIGVRIGGKTCAARPREGWRQAGSQFMRAARMVEAIEESKRSNIAAMLERRKTVS